MMENTESSGREAGAVIITEQERDLAQNALAEFQKRSYTSCLTYLNKLEALRPKDLKVMHNKVIIEYYKNDLKRTELAKKSLNAICGAPTTLDSAPDNADDVEKSVMRFNQAVLLYHTGQDEPALQILTRLFALVEPMADIFENFRWSCFASYNLDPLHYYTARGLAFDAMLKITGVQLELFQDPEMLLFIEKGRGGLSQCSNRYGRASNYYMGADEYNPAEQKSYLMYLDVNNLYGAAMNHHLPNGNLCWLEDWSSLNVLKIPDDSETGYILEVDLEYPQELHEEHKDLPLCPEHIIPPNGQSKLPKLLTTLN